MPGAVRDDDVTHAPRRAAAGRAGEHALDAGHVAQRAGDALARRPARTAPSPAGPASIVTNAARALLAERPHAMDALDRRAAPVEERRTGGEADGVHLERAVLGHEPERLEVAAAIARARLGEVARRAARPRRDRAARRRRALHALARRDRLRRARW